MEFKNSDFVIDIPDIHPLSPNYLKFWRDMKDKCINGMWFGGRWCPPKLFFYANFATIKANKNATSKSKEWTRPSLRDIEWEVFYHITEARGFSGFTNDEQYTCVRALEEAKTDEEIEHVKILYPEVVNSHGRLKQYIPAREYMRKQFQFAMGNPLFSNPALNLIWLTARGIGKSYMMGGGVVPHEFLFDGQDTDNSNAERSVNILIGAAESKYTKETLDKTKACLLRLPGGKKINDKYYPPPFSKSNLKGSWDKDIMDTRKEKIGNKWTEKGTGSRISNRVFSDNVFAGQGMRNSIVLLEEVGMFKNFIAAKQTLEENMKHSGTIKFGTGIFIGTGGDMTGGGTWDAKKVFYNPATFDCLTFKDDYEGTVNPIGYFNPAYFGLNHHRDSNGKLNIEAAKAEIMRIREKKMSVAGGSDELSAFIQNQPLVPSEVFLTREGNIFPTMEIKNRLDIVERYNIGDYVGKRVSLAFDNKAKYGVDYQIDLTNKLTPINEFPIKEGIDRTGCVVIYEFPEYAEDGNVPIGMYIIGHDPYASDADTGASLGAIVVLKTSKYPKYGFNEIVAVYYGRPYEGRDVVNEILLKLAMFYNAKVFFENMVGNVKEYFQKMKSLHYLAKRPTTVLTAKDNQGRDTNEYGYPMSSEKFKKESLQYVRDWLLEERGVQDGVIIRNLDKIPDRFLLQQLLSFTMKGNFDAVMAFCGCVIGLEETFNKHQNKLLENKENEVISFFKKNSKQFR